MKSTVLRAAWAPMLFFAWLLCMTVPAQANEVAWTIPQFSFRASDGGGAASGKFVFDQAATDRVRSWKITVSAGPPTYTAFTYQSGTVGHTADVTSTGTVRFFYNFGLPTQRYVFLFHAATGLPDNSGVYVAPGYNTSTGDGSGEYVSGPPTNVRYFAQAQQLSGVLQSRATPGDVAGSCRANPAVTHGDPVDLRTGAYTFTAPVMTGVDSFLPFLFDLYYDSSSTAGDLGVGQKWSHSYRWRIVGIGTQSLKVVRGDGAADYFDPRVVTGGAVEYFASFPQTLTRLDANADGTFTYTELDRLRYTFDTQGRLKSISDRSNQTASLSYDGSGRLTTFTGPPPASRVATFAYDANNRITAVDYAAGLMHVTLVYDGAGNLASFSSPTNPSLTTRFTYDASGNLLKGTAGTGPADDIQFVSNTYTAGKVTSQSDATGGITTFAYTATQTTVTDPNLRTSTRTFDTAGRIIGAMNPDGASFTWSYDAAGNINQLSGPRGTRTTTYDADGKAVGLSLENGNGMALIWDKDSKVTGVSDGNSWYRFYSYDNAGNLTSFTNPVGMGITNQVDATGRLTMHTDATGASTSLTYTATGAIDKVTTPTGNVALAYDAMGRTNSITDQNGKMTALAFDAAGAMSAYTDPMGKTTAFNNDAFGRLKKEMAPDGQSVTYERDAKDQITATIDGKGNRITYTYDGNGRMTSKTDALGSTTLYRYNAGGQLDKVTDALGGTVTATFDAAGRRVSVTDQNGKTSTYTYDSLGRVSSEADPLGRQDSTQHDGAGSIVSTTNGRAQSITYGHDDAGSVTAITLPGETINFTLNPEGLRISASHAAGTTTTLFDNALGRVNKRTDEFGNQIQYAYDAVGNLTTLTYSDGKAVTYTYDAANRMTSVKDWANRTTTYTYDDGGSLAKMVMPDGSSVAYTHDAAGHLMTMVDTSSSGATLFAGRFIYDASGRTTSANQTLPLHPTLTAGTSVITVDAANQITAVNGVAFTYDADGNVTSGMIAGVSTTLVYDALNRLKQRNADVYRYDTDNFRIQTTRGAVVTRYVWDGTSRNLKLLEEQNGSGAIIARYVHGGIGLIGREDAATGAFSVYHYDPRGSTLALTNMAGIITDRYAYDPFGAVAGSQGTTPNPFTFNGRDGVFDDRTGLYYMTSRFYIPSLGRFAQKEAVYRGSIFRPGTLNRYAYGENNPVDHVDPRGEWGFLAFAAIGAVVSGVTQIVSNAAAHKPWYEGVAGAVVSGAISGAAMVLGPWGQAAAGAIAAGAGNAINQGIDLASGKRKSFDLTGLGTDMAIGGVTGGLMGKFFPGPASPKGILKNLKPVVEDAYGLGGAYVAKKTAAEIRNAQLIAATKYKGNLANLFIGGPGKGLSEKNFGTTVVDDIVKGVTGTTSEYCDLKTRGSIAGYLSGYPTQSNYYIDTPKLQVVSVRK